MRTVVVLCLILGVVVELSPLLSRAVQAQSTTSASWLHPHNSARRAENAGIPDLVWDSTLEQYATNWAEHQATQDSCHFIHSGGQYGENLYGADDATPEMAVKAFVDERQYYDYASNSCAPNALCDHYTQVVWKKSLRLGCGQATCSDGLIFMICSYDPPGNYVGQRPF